MRTIGFYSVSRTLILLFCLISFSVFSKPAPLRIVSANGTLSEILVGLGLESQIVGVDVTSTYPASLEKLPKIGHNRNISSEGILALNPDVIVTSDQSMMSATVLKQLNSSGKKL